MTPSAAEKRRSCQGGERKSSRKIYELLTESGILDGAFDFAAFDALAEKALHEELPGYDPWELLAGLESVMTQLGVMPFDEEELPKEDPATF